MKRPRMGTLGLWLLGLAILIALFPVPSCRVVAEADLHTGSRRGYTRWPWGARTTGWHCPSVIETYMRDTHAAEFRQVWVSYQGNEYNIFGMLLSRVHGSPGPMLSLHPSVIDEYCRNKHDAEKLRIYEVLAHGDEERIKDLIEEILIGPTNHAGTPSAAAPLRWHPMDRSIKECLRMKHGSTLVVLFSNEWESSSAVLKKLLTDSVSFRHAVESEGALLFEADVTQPESVGQRELSLFGGDYTPRVLVARPDQSPQWITARPFSLAENLREAFREQEKAVVALLAPPALRPVPSGR